MIKSYQVEQNLNTTDGITADISFGLRATGVPVPIAHEIESEFSKFMGRVTGGSVTMTQATTRTLEWTPEEIYSIKDCKTVAEARRKYRETFPESFRSRQAVKTKFAELRKKPAKPDISAGGLSGVPAAVAAEIPKTPAAKMPVAEKPEPVKKTRQRKGPAKGNKYGIPTELAKMDIRKYQRLWFRCSHKGIMYEEALKMEKPAPDTSKQLSEVIAPSNEGKKPAKVKKARLPLRMKNQQPAPEASEEKPVTTHYPVETPHTAAAEDPLDPQEPEYHIGGLDQDLTDALPDEAPPTGHKEKVENAKTMESIKIGDQVRQIAGMKICAGIGVVKRAPPGNPDVLVGFGNGQEWINRKNLAPVMA